MRCKAFAIITHDKVKKIILSDDKKTLTVLSKIFYGNTVVVVDCSEYNVTKGDYYIDGVFYHNDKETPVSRITTDDDHSEYSMDTLSEDIDYLSKKIHDDAKLLHNTEEKLIYLLGKNNLGNH